MWRARCLLRCSHKHELGLETLNVFFLCLLNSIIHFHGRNSKPWDVAFQTVLKLECWILKCLLVPSPWRAPKPCKFCSTQTHDSNSTLYNLFFHVVHLPCLYKCTAICPHRWNAFTSFLVIKPYRAFWSLIYLNIWSLTYWSKIPFPSYPLLVTPTASDLVQVLLFTYQKYFSDLSLLMGHQASRIILFKH